MNRRRATTLGLLASLVSALLWLGGAPIAQSSSPAQASRPTSVLSSVKLNKIGGSFEMAFRPGGRFNGRGVTLKMLIAYAYGGETRRMLQESEIIGGPDWIDEDRYDILAKSDEDLPGARFGPSPEMFAMLRTLLADRFQLRVHTESKEVSIYALVMARSDGRFGPRLHPTTLRCQGRTGPLPDAKPGDRLCGITGARPQGISGGDVSMAQLATVLSTRAGRLVEDRTGLTGRFDLDLDWNDTLRVQPIDDTVRIVEDQTAWLFTAVPEQLGLDLEAAKSAVSVVVIDHAEKPTID
jgi:uncharacterized protein (TIGR03435 family)